MNEKLPDAAVKGIARRRLLRGTFVAPAVLTLVSGSALAAGSTSCVVNQRETNRLGLNPSDTWVRLPLYEFTDPVGDSGQVNYVRFVSGTDISLLLPLGGTSSVSVGSFQCVEKVVLGQAFSTYTVGQSYSFATGLEPTLMKPATYVAIRVDDKGKVLGGELTGTANSGSAMSFVCWSSFGGMNPFG